MTSRLSFASSALALLAACSCSSNASRTPPPAQAAASSNAVDLGATIATIDGQPITYGDIDKEVGTKVRQAEAEALTKVYELRKNALDELVSKRLLEGEAKKAGKTLDDWFSKDVIAATKEPNDADVKNFFVEHQKEMQGHDFNEMKPQLVEYMKKDATRKYLTDLLEKLKKEHGVTIALAPPKLPKIEVAATGPMKGNKDAKITIVTFSDFQCPFCSRALPTEERVLKEYGDKVKVVFRNFPLSFHPFAEKAAEAGACANDQGKFWEMHDAMFGNQSKLGVDDLKASAHAISGMDAKKFDACLDGGSKKALIDADQAAGAEAGVQGTPAFFVNGQFLNGAVPFEDFKAVIDRELAN